MHLPGIKSVVVPCLIGDEDEFQRLQELLSEIGFEDGDGWDDEHSRGTPFLTPLGALELVHGRPPADAALLVEVDDLDRVLQIVQRHGIPLRRDPQQTHWKSRLFVAEIGKLPVAFFTYVEDGQDVAAA